MSGEFHGEPERIMVSLDAVGNTTKAVTKGFAIGSAVIAAVALFATHRDDRRRAGPDVGTALFKAAETQINVADVKTFIGLLLGGSVAFLFSALAISAVGRTAEVVVQEVRNRSTEDHGRGEGPRLRPGDRHLHGRAVVGARQSALLAVLAPVWSASASATPRFGALLAYVILTGQLMANSSSNAGGAWDNAKKYIEDGNHGGKGSDGSQGRRDRRHRRRPVQGHGRSRPEPADQGDEPRRLARASGDHPLGATTTAPALDRRRLARGPAGAVVYSKTRRPVLAPDPSRYASPPPEVGEQDARNLHPNSPLRGWRWGKGVRTGSTARRGRWPRRSPDRRGDRRRPRSPRCRSRSVERTTCSGRPMAAGDRAVPR
ncbi:MAG: sodium/proton-translocating pyrophosphatase [Acidimicrobiales bacterium]